MDRRMLLTSLLTAPAWRLTAQDAPRQRLFLDAQRLERLRTEIRTTHAGVWESVRRDADSWVRRAPPAYAAPADPNDEQLWQREVGNKLPFFAIAHLLTG